jgi:hypothetical protein
MTAKNRKPPPAEKPDYKPTERDLAAVLRFLEKPRVPRVKVSKGGDGPTITPDHPDDTIGRLHLMEALGTTDWDFSNSLLSQFANASSRGGEIDEGGLNFMLSVVKSIKPRDHIEAMLAAQMAATHIATMTFANRLANVEDIPQQDSAERAFNKLARTFAAQTEALKRYRTGGEQKVTVQHVTVSEGGQAIVGNVTQGQREAAPDTAAASPSLLTDAKTAPMPIVEESKKQDPVPAPRTLKMK